jgi:uncharacterized RDD family membrane protein YckC
MAQVDSVAAWPSRRRRAGAFVIDFIILGAVTFGIGLAAYGALSASPLLGRAIGFVIGAAYFGILCSRLGGGATAGMRLLGLRVVSAKGGPVALGVSFGRAALLVAPIILNGAFFNFDANALVMGVVGVLLMMLIFGVGLAQLYLLLFSRRTGRLLHDILFRTAVVRAGAEVANLAPVGSAAKIAGGIVAASGVVTAGLVIAAPALLPSSLHRLTPPMEAVRALPEVVTAGVVDQTVTWASAGGARSTVHSLKITARLRRWPKDLQAEIDRIGALATSTYHPAPEQVVRVELVQGFEMGFSSISTSQVRDYTPGSPAAQSQARGRSAPAEPSGEPQR